jgi:mannose/fructose/N-acetylgalactosamine-specific phosphotransferase system component IIB
MKKRKKNNLCKSVLPRSVAKQSVVSEPVCREFVRVDDRFFHGQIKYGWARHLQPRRIVVGNDRLARREDTRRMFEAAVEDGPPLSVCSVHRAAALAARVNDARLMVILGSLHDAWRYYRCGRRIVRLNVGNLPGGRTPLGARERLALSRLSARGVAVEVKGMPGDKPLDLPRFLARRER